MSMFSERKEKQSLTNFQLKATEFHCFITLKLFIYLLFIDIYIAPYIYNQLHSQALYSTKMWLSYLTEKILQPIVPNTSPGS